MPSIKRNLTNAQFLAALAEVGSWVGGIPFVFDPKSESGSRFLERLRLMGLSASPEEIMEAIPKFFKEREKWGISLVRFDKLVGGRFEVGLNPDEVAIDFSALASKKSIF
ncbi:MAG TPA: hypothetical protein VI978_00260 [Candidatus Paceibacterota bacterium]